VRKFGLAEKLTRNEISKYERGVREPALAVLLKYARAANVNVEVLMDDELELPRAFGQTITRRKQHSKKKRSKK
jgi:transcriptional regulator with XRE-family HTH domain